MKSIIRGHAPGVGYIVPEIDHESLCWITIGNEHTMTHRGDHYLLQHYFAEIDDTDYGRIRFKTDAEAEVHAVFFVLATAGVLFAVYETPSFTHASGNTITSINRNREYAATKTGKLQEACHTPSGSGEGTVLMGPLAIGAGGRPARSGPGQTRDSNEWVLNPDTVYLVEVQSLSDNNMVTIGIDYYWR